MPGRRRAECPRVAPHALATHESDRERRLALPRPTGEKEDSAMNANLRGVLSDDEREAINVEGLLDEACDDAAEWALSADEGTFNVAALTAFRAADAYFAPTPKPSFNGRLAKRIKQKWGA